MLEVSTNKPRHFALRIERLLERYRFLSGSTRESLMVRRAYRSAQMMKILIKTGIFREKILKYLRIELKQVLNYIKEDSSSGKSD